MTDVDHYIEVKKYIPDQVTSKRISVMQTLINAYTDLYINTHILEDVDFKTARNDVLKAVEEDVDRVMKAGEQK